MPHYKVTYFDFPGRGEALRLTLTIGNIPFEDERLHQQEFAEIRSKLPYGSLPTIAIDGKVYVQSSAILRYLGKITKLYPEDLHLSLCVDEVMDTVIDFITGIEEINNQDKVTFEKAMTEYLEAFVPRYLGSLEHRMKNFGDGPWAVGSSITIADLAIYMLVLNATAGAWDYFNVSRLSGYPRLMQAAESVQHHPSVMKWNKSINEKAAAVKSRRKTMEARLQTA